MGELNVEVAVAIISAVIAFITAVTSIYYNHRTINSYREALRPVLRFDLYERDAVLYLKVTNIGQSAATNIYVDIDRITGNGDNFIADNNMYTYHTFDLYPTESIEAIVSTLETHMFTEHPIIHIETKYKEQLSGKNQKYERKVMCNRSFK